MKKRQLWGAIKEEDTEKNSKQKQLDQQIFYEKQSELKILHSSVFFESKEKRIKLYHKNSQVNQIVGLKQKQELIEDIIESSKNDYYNFQQILHDANLRDTLDTLNQIGHNLTQTKAQKFNFITSAHSNFTAGQNCSQEIQKINKKCVKLALKKSICGLLRIADYTDAESSALQMLIDATDLFYKSLMGSIVNILEEDRETETEIDLMTFEKAYFNMTNESSVVFLSYFKNNIYDKHLNAANEFSEKVEELRNIVTQNQMVNEIQASDFPSHFFVKEELNDYDN